ncbi:MAG: LacI family transcriptional regulator [bacterium]|nr:LacI family transcriptional regulator [bacterium]
MHTKYTIRDIAKMAGVSAATVSYVINNREDQRISAETKKKVLQIVNLLGYSPNSSAKSLATNKTSHVALYLSREDSLYKRCEQLSMIEALSHVLKEHGYHLLVLDRDDRDKIDYADAIICYDDTADFFSEVGDKNFIPLIGLDLLTDTPLQIFFQVCTDYQALKDAADAHFGTDRYAYFCLEPNNHAVRELILRTFAQVHFVESGSVVPDGNLCYSQTSLCPLLGSTALYLPLDLHRKMERLYACMELALNRVPDCDHVVFV